MRYYLDCEFDGWSDLGPTPLISLALVREDGESLYVVAQETAQDDWVRENVLPVLWKGPGGRRSVGPLTTALEVQMFLRDDRDPVIIADWPDDIAHICTVALTGPGTMINVPSLKFEMHRVDAYPTTLEINGHSAVQHNAWWDAMALRHMLQTSLG